MFFFFCFFSFFLLTSPVSYRKDCASSTVWNCFAGSFWNSGILAMQNVFFFFCFFSFFSIKESCFLQKRPREFYCWNCFAGSCCGNLAMQNMFFSFYLAKNPVYESKERASSTIWNCFAFSFWNSRKFAMQNMFFLLIIIFRKECESLNIWNCFLLRISHNGLKWNNENGACKIYLNIWV